jgi:transcriptional regulator with XRE-family HTH domain
MQGGDRTRPAMSKGLLQAVAGHLSSGNFLMGQLNCGCTLTCSIVHVVETSQLPELIGQRVRQERQSKRWTLDHLADFSDVSRRMLISIEQGVANPSIGILLKISDALGVGLAALVEQPRQTSFTVTRNGTGPVLWSGDAGGRALLVASTAPPQVVELWDWTLGAGERYAHDGHVAGTRELLHVLKGKVAVELDAEIVALATGDAVAFASDVPHAYSNPGTTLARFALSVFEPDVGIAPRRAPRA